MGPAIVVYTLVITLSSSVLENVSAQTRPDSGTVFKSLENLIEEVGNLRTEIRDQASALNNLVTKEELESVLSTALDGLQAKIEGQETLLRHLTSKEEIQVNTLDNLVEKADTQATLLADLNENVEVLATSLSDLKAESKLHKTSLNTIESNTATQENLLNNLVAEVEWHEPVPHFNTNRTNVALKGDNVEMWCIVRGTPFPDIKWTRENGELESNRIVVENNGQVLRIKNAQLSDGGCYFCVAANGVGTPAIQSVRLEVYDPAQRCHRIIESDRANLAIKTFTTGCLWVIKLQNTTGFRLKFNSLMIEPIVVIPEQSSSVSRVQPIQINGSRNASHDFEGKTLAIVVPPGRERRPLSWAGLPLDDSGAASSAKVVNDCNRILEWNSTRDGTENIFWTFEMSGELNWTLSTPLTARGQKNTCENISFSVLQIRPDGNVNEIQKTCNGSSEGSITLNIPSQVLVLLHIKSLEAAKSRLQVSCTQQDQLLRTQVDGVVAGAEAGGGFIMIPFNSTKTKAVSSGTIYGLTFDWISRRIYYVERGNGMLRSNLDGTKSEILLSDQSSVLRGVHVEQTTGNLYYGNLTSGSIRVCDNDANKCSTIFASIGDLTSPVFDFAVHRSKGLLFWSIYDKKIVGANLDGSNVTVILERQVWGLDMDEYEDRLYWGSRNGIGSCDLNGQDIPMVPNLTPFITDVAIDGDKLYYINYHADSIHVIKEVQQSLEGSHTSS